MSELSPDPEKIVQAQRTFSEFVGQHLLGESSSLTNPSIQDGVIRRRGVYKVMHDLYEASPTVAVCSRYIYETQPGVYQPRDVVNIFSYMPVLNPTSKQTSWESSNIRISLCAGQFAFEGMEIEAPENTHHLIAVSTVERLGKYERIGELLAA